MVQRRITATEARIHFGQLMREVTESGNTVVVEKSGKPSVVVMSAEEYRRLRRERGDESDWWDLMERSREAFRPTAERGMIPNAAELINRLREERDEQLLDTLPRR